MTRTIIGRYVLDHRGNPMQCEDTLLWGAFVEDIERRRVALDDLGNCQVSTVFLGLDHNHGSHGPPILWETLVQGGPLDGWMRRYASREEAERGHRDVVILTRATIAGKAALAELEAMPGTLVVHDDGHASISCPRCGLRSHNENDVRERYCGACHEWHRNMATDRE